VISRTLTRSEARAVYDRIGRAQDTQAFYEDPAHDALIAHGDLGAARSILEVGCGTGRLAERLLRDHCSPSVHYVGVDLSPRMVEIARDRLASFGQRATVVTTDGTLSFDLADGSQDRIVATYLLDLLSENDIRAFLAEAHRLLGATGRLCLAGLTAGNDGLARFVSGAWAAVHALRPEWVGGCRPLRMRPFVDDEAWTITHRDVVRAWGVPSEVLVTVPARTDSLS
jgi:ubiquinone/menaquinone biosynthesis C-methylase UbiE